MLAVPVHALIDDLAPIPAGAFLMGSACGRPDEQPPHAVRLPAFLAARCPVSNAAYARFVAETAAAPPPFLHDPRFTDPATPVVGVNWFDAVAYCRWLAQRTGVPVRLPTEAEREYAARGGLEGVDWPWGSTPPSQHAPAIAITALDCPHRPRPDCVNGYGLRCMAENVHEWCSDWYAPDAYTATISFAPAGPRTGIRRAGRGGSWRHAVKCTRLSARASLNPGFRYNDFGFRLFASA